jgi:hypothetical protein
LHIFLCLKFQFYFFSAFFSDDPFQVLHSLLSYSCCYFLNPRISKFFFSSSSSSSSRWTQFQHFFEEMLDSTNSEPDFMNTIIIADESWGTDTTRKPNLSVIFLNANPTRALNTTSSNAACHQLTHLTGRKNSRMLMKIQGSPMQARFIEIHRFSQKKKSDTFLTDQFFTCYISFTL